MMRYLCSTVVFIIVAMLLVTSSCEALTVKPSSGNTQQQQQQQLLPPFVGVASDGDLHPQQVVEPAHQVSPGWSSRLPRSPFTPPTVASQQPHRKGISLKMIDSSLQVGIQSEGPYHPALMRKSPNRKQQANILKSEEHIARPHTMTQLPHKPVMLLDDYSRLNPIAHQTQYGSDQQQYPIANRLKSQNQYVEYDDNTHADRYYADHDYGTDLNVRQSEDNIRSRQRRVENSLGRETENVRHGRFEEYLSNREQNQNKPLERYDTFGLPISEELWSGPRRSVTPIHPAARAVSNRGREQHPSAGGGDIWSRSSSRRYGGSRFGQPQQTTHIGNANTDHIIVGERHDGNSRTNVLFHPGARMTNRGSSSRNRGSRPQETIIIHGSNDIRSGHPRMSMRPRKYDSSLPSHEEALSLENVIDRMNQTYEELNITLEEKGLSLSYLMRLLSKGTPLEEIVKILEFSVTTSTEASSQTEDPFIWEEWSNSESNEGNFMENPSNHPIEIDREISDDPYYSDPVYAKGIQPIHENIEGMREFYTSTESYDQIYEPNLSYNDYYSQEIDEHPRKSNGQARIHSFTVHELPADENSQSSQYEQANTSGYSSNSPHPHYNQWDQSYETNDLHSNNLPKDDLNPQSSSNILLQAITDDADLWGYGNDPATSGRPLTYTIIAASAIMGSLAIFTFFVIIAYTVVKCTKKPTLNNYQISNKKPVEITV